jgi:hypothetical protein
MGLRASLEAVVLKSIPNKVWGRVPPILRDRLRSRTTFMCRRCLGTMKDDDLVEKCDNWQRGGVRKFCYLGDMLDADGGVDSAVTTRVRRAWNKFRELAPFLTAKRYPYR